MAFLITFDEPEEYNFGLVELSRWRNEHVNYEVEVPVYLSRIIPQYWPEAPTDTSIIMYGQEAIVSYDWKKFKANNPLQRTRKPRR